MEITKLAKILGIKYSIDGRLPVPNYSNFYLFNTFREKVLEEMHKSLDKMPDIE